MTRKQIEEMMAKQKEVAKTKPFMNTEMGQYAYQLGFEDGADWALSHQWVSVEDELPPVGEWVLIYFLAEYGKSKTFACFDGKYWVHDIVGEVTITHWMPIPPLAEEGGEK